MAFHFRFEQLMKYRKHQMEREEYEHGRILKQVKDLERKYAEIEQQKSLCEELLNEKQVQGIQAHEYLLLVENIQGLEHKLLEVKNQLSKALKELELQREKLLEAKKKVETLETLKSYEFENYKSEERKKERKFIDDLVVMQTSGNSYEI